MHLHIETYITVIVTPNEESVFQLSRHIRFEHVLILAVRRCRDSAPVSSCSWSGGRWTRGQGGMGGCTQRSGGRVEVGLISPLGVWEGSTRK